MTLPAPFLLALALGGAPELSPRLAVEAPGVADARALERALAEDPEVSREAKAERTRRGRMFLIAAGATALAGVLMNLYASNSGNPLEVGLAALQSKGFFIGSACFTVAGLRVLGTDPPEATP